jgi:hypothetical protein
MNTNLAQNKAYSDMEKCVDTFTQEVVDTPAHVTAQSVDRHLKENQRLIEKVDTALDFMPRTKDLIGEYLVLTNAAAKNLATSVTQASKQVHGEEALAHAVPAVDAVTKSGEVYCRANEAMLGDFATHTQDKDTQYRLGVTAGHYQAAQEFMAEGRLEGLIDSLQSPYLVEYALEDARTNNMVTIPKKQHTGIVLNTLDTGDGKHDTLILADANKKLYAFPVEKGHGLEQGDIARASRKSFDDFFNASRVNEQKRDVSKGIGA